MSKTRRPIVDVIKDCAIRQQDPEDPSTYYQTAMSERVLCTHEEIMPRIYIDEFEYAPNLMLCTGHVHRFVMELKEDA